MENLSVKIMFAIQWTTVEIIVTTLVQAELPYIFDAYIKALNS